MVLVNSDTRNLKRLGYVDVKKGSGLYLPKGYGFADYITPIANFISNNKDTIKNVADATGKVASLGSSTLDLIKQIRNTKQQNKEFDKIREKVRTGEGFKVMP